MTRLRRDRVGGPVRFAEPVLFDELGRLVPVDATTYVDMPPDLAEFTPGAWPSPPDCEVLGCTNEFRGRSAWAAARYEWCEQNLTHNEAAADRWSVNGDECFHPELL